MNINKNAVTAFGIVYGVLLTKFFAFNFILLSLKDTFQRTNVLGILTILIGIVICILARYIYPEQFNLPVFLGTIIYLLISVT